jgi:GT2 family glycosyltransferase
VTQPPHADPSATVSVVIPSVRPDLLADQLQALAGQRFDRPWEVVIVTADPPTDSPGDLPIRTVRVDGPLPPGAARNLGVAAARGELLAFCDDDDLVAAGWLAAIVDALQDHDVVGGAEDVDRLNDPGAIAGSGRYPGIATALPTVSGWRPFIETTNLGIRRTAFERVGGFDERFVASEDRDLSLRLQAAGFQLWFAPAAVIHRRLRVGPRAQAHQAVVWGRSEVLLYRCHRGDGMPPAGPDGGWRAWARLVRDLPHLADRARRGVWLRRGAYRVGRLVGSLQYRTRYL